MRETHAHRTDADEEEHGAGGGRRPDGLAARHGRRHGPGRPGGRLQGGWQLHREDHGAKVTGTRYCCGTDGDKVTGRGYRDTNCDDV
ncbi:hypothetical protein [Streptomyces sp. NPDC002559]